MANAESKRLDKGHHDVSGKDKGESSHTKHVDTGEHAKKKTMERAHVADEGLGMSKYDAPRKS
jgi:hypothetical protein